MSRSRRKFREKVNYTGKVVRDIDIILNAGKNEQIRQKEKERLSQDIKIRKYVRRKLEEYLEEGDSSEKAADLIAQEKGIDIKEMFKNWVQELEYSSDGEER